MRKKPDLLYYVPDTPSYRNNIDVFDIFPEQNYFTLIRFVQTVYHLKEGCLSAAARA